uniref:Uncharacterized protein n=1 Tax=Anguilla anguilla TaxID=7936 RepID=A0A0E9S070_ANGAN
MEQTLQNTRVLCFHLLSFFLHGGFHKILRWLKMFMQMLKKGQGCS